MSWGKLGVGNIKSLEIELWAGKNLCNLLKPDSACNVRAFPRLLAGWSDGVFVHIPSSSTDISDGNEIISRDGLLDDLISEQSHEEEVLFLETRAKKNDRVSNVSVNKN